MKIIHFLNHQIKALGLDLTTIVKSIQSLPWFITSFIQFKRLNNKSKRNWKIVPSPYYLDQGSNAANLGEYFWQDIFVARKIIELSPIEHLDVGSRIDGFVSIISSHMKISVIDIRPLYNEIPNVIFHQVDLNKLPSDFINKFDSVSCLHSLEHFGLGRYGDQLDVDGWESGLKALANCLKPSGRLHLTVPVGIERVEFNANRVFSPLTVLTELKYLGFEIIEFYLISAAENKKIKLNEKNIKAIESETYGLGHFLAAKQSI